MLPVKDLSQEYLRELAARENQLGQVFTRSFPVSPLPQVSFSESGSLGNSSGSDVTSLSSQLPDTPHSMVPSPVETGGGTLPRQPADLACSLHVTHPCSGHTSSENSLAFVIMIVVI